MVAVRKDLEICLGRGSTKIPLLTELQQKFRLGFLKNKILLLFVFLPHFQNTVE
jgi:hypothetical protein